MLPIYVPVVKAQLNELISSCCVHTRSLAIAAEWHGAVMIDAILHLTNNVTLAGILERELLLCRYPGTPERMLASRGADLVVLLCFNFNEHVLWMVTVEGCGRK
jgi:hypothetical protein